MAKLYSIKKKSIITVGNFVFVHGGLSLDLVKKYTIGEINQVVSKWMCKNNNETEEKLSQIEVIQSVQNTPSESQQNQGVEYPDLDVTKGNVP